MSSKSCADKIKRTQIFIWRCYKIKWPEKFLLSFSNILYLFANVRLVFVCLKINYTCSRGAESAVSWFSPLLEFGFILFFDMLGEILRQKIRESALCALYPVNIPHACMLNSGERKMYSIFLTRKLTYREGNGFPIF